MNDSPNDTSSSVSQRHPGSAPLSGRMGLWTTVTVVVAWFALTLPLLLVKVPPVTDLPQQMAQMRLAEEAMQHPEGPYRMQWWEPNKLGYVPLWLAWQIAPPLTAGRLAVAFIALAWVVAVIALARHRRRSLAAATMACLLFLNHALYWGLLNFLVGLPVFVLWWILLTPTDANRAPDFGWWRGTALAGTACLLYSAHVLWLAAGIGWLLADGLVQRASRRRWGIYAVALLPVVLATALWYPKLASRGFDSETFWQLGQRWHPGWWVGSAFGGLRGSTESWIALCGLIWVLVGWAGSRRRGQTVSTDTATTLDRRLLLTALGAVGAALLLPGVFQNTVFFASRWLPVGLVFLVLAVPPPDVRKALKLAIPWLLLVTLSIATCDAWLTFDGEELAGLENALRHIEPMADTEGGTAASLSSALRPRVLGLDFIRTSESIQGYPYYHLYAWAQALHGGELARSFANEASSLVVYKDLPRPLPWTPGLDWRARKLRRSDIDHFDYVILHAEAEMQRPFFADPRLVPVTPPQRWSLFRVRTPPVDAAQGATTQGATTDPPEPPSEAPPES